MGVEGLWKYLRPLEYNCDALDIRGVVGIDAMNWMAKYTRQVSESLARGDIGPLLHLLNRTLARYRSFGWEIIVVFDGCNPPMKEDEHQRRRQERQKYWELSKALWIASRLKGKYVEECSSKAIELFAKAPPLRRIAKGIFDGLTASGNYCLVAPMEAEAQLGYMWQQGLVQFVLSADGDVSAYGSGRIIRHVHAGKRRCQVVDLTTEAARREPFTTFTPSRALPDVIARILCFVLCGSDYTPFLGRNLHTVLRFVVDNHQAGVMDVRRVREILHVFLCHDWKGPTSSDGSGAVLTLSEAVTRCHHAFMAMLHHIVYDSHARNIRHFHSLDFDAPLARAVAGGDEFYGRDPVELCERGSLIVRSDVEPFLPSDDLLGKVAGESIDDLNSLIVQSKHWVQYKPMHSSGSSCVLCGTTQSSPASALDHLRGLVHHSRSLLAQLLELPSPVPVERRVVCEPDLLGLYVEIDDPVALSELIAAVGQGHRDIDVVSVESEDLDHRLTAVQVESTSSSLPATESLPASVTIKPAPQQSRQAPSTVNRRRKAEPCRYFSSPGGCARGAGCWYAHILPAI